MVLAAIALMAPAKRSYENVNREIMIEPYWDDAQPASNILPGARVHERDEKSKFEARSFTSFKSRQFSDAVVGADMKVLNILKAHSTFERGGQKVELDFEALRRYLVSSGSNPDVEAVLVFKAGFLLIAIAKDDGFSDVLIPIDPAIATELAEAVKGAS
ncbi:MAG: hypothetical protein U0166_23595 [Acidobacteriota bacterium]